MSVKILINSTMQDAMESELKGADNDQTQDLGGFGKYAEKSKNVSKGRP
jgi:hypothetical protein